MGPDTLGEDCLYPLVWRKIVRNAGTAGARPDGGSTVGCGVADPFLEDAVAAKRNPNAVRLYCHGAVGGAVLHATVLRAHARVCDGRGDFGGRGVAVVDCVLSASGSVWGRGDKPVAGESCLAGVDSAGFLR